MDNPCGTLVTVRHVITGVDPVGVGRSLVKIACPPGHLFTIPAVAMMFGTSCENVRKILSRASPQFTKPFIYRQRRHRGDFRLRRYLYESDLEVFRLKFTFLVK